MRIKDRYRVVFTTLGVVLCFFVFGYCDAIRGASLPEVRSSFSMSYGVSGAILVLHYTGYCSASLIFGACSGRIPKRISAVFGSGILVAGILLYILAKNLYVFLPAIFLIGFALGLYEYIGNTIIADIFPEENRGKFANLAAGGHSVGAILAPAAYSRIVGAGGDYHTAFLILLPLPIIAILLFLLFSYPDKTYLIERPVAIKQVIRAFAWPEALRYYVMAVSYIAAEAGIITWMVSYLQDSRGFSSTNANAYLSWFFVLLGTGRLLGGPFVDRIGCGRILRIVFPASAGCIGIGLLFPDICTPALPIAALFMSVIFPTLAVSLCADCKRDTGVVMGSFYCFAALGGAIGSWLVGLLSQQFHPAAGIFSSVVFCLAGFVAAMTGKKNKNITLNISEAE